MSLSTPHSAILSAVIFNALIIVALIPLALRGVRFRAASAASVLRRNLLIYGLGGLVTPFVGIKLIDLLRRRPSRIVMRRQLLSGFLVLVAFTALAGVLYPLVVTGIAQVAFPGRADGSPFATATASSGRGSSASPSPHLATSIPAPPPRVRATTARQAEHRTSAPRARFSPTRCASRAAAYRRMNGLAPADPVPIDAVTASASGLDPHISPENARAQAARVAAARGLPVDRVLALVAGHTAGRRLGVLGEPTVNVLELNLALDGQG